MARQLTISRVDDPDQASGFFDCTVTFADDTQAISEGNESELRYWIWCARRGGVVRSIAMTEVALDVLNGPSRRGSWSSPGTSPE